MQAASHCKQRSEAEQNLGGTISPLSRTPAALNALLRDLPDAWTMQNEGGETWNVFDVIVHLIHGERTDWMPRTQMILQFGETKSFIPFDRFVQFQESRGRRGDRNANGSPLPAYPGQKFAACKVLL